MEIQEPDLQEDVEPRRQSGGMVLQGTCEGIKTYGGTKEQSRAQGKGRGGANSRGPSPVTLWGSKAAEVAPPSTESSGGLPAPGKRLLGCGPPGEFVPQTLYDLYPVPVAFSSGILVLSRSFFASGFFQCFSSPPG